MNNTVPCEEQQLWKAKYQKRLMPNVKLWRGVGEEILLKILGCMSLQRIQLVGIGNLCYNTFLHAQILSTRTDTAKEQCG